jgi:enterochelin esterase-like enzyme
MEIIRGPLLTLAGFCVLAVSAALAAPTAEPCRSTVTGDLRVEHFNSTVFGDAQTLRIWLPPGYNDAANGKRAYPVMMMLDGENLFDACTSGFGHEWQVDETLTRLIGNGAVEPIIVVGIDSPGKRRADEYLPVADSVFSGAAEPHGALFPRFLVDEVLPLVSKEFRIESGPEHTGIGGSSYGSIAALNALITRPEVFGLGLLESTSLQAGNGEMLRRTMALGVGPRRAFVGVGTAEVAGHDDAMRPHALVAKDFDTGILQMSQQLAANLKGAALNHAEVMFVATPGAHHEEQAWAQRFSAAIQFLFPKKP